MKIEKGETGTSFYTNRALSFDEIKQVSDIILELEAARKPHVSIEMMDKVPLCSLCDFIVKISDGSWICGDLNRSGIEASPGQVGSGDDPDDVLNHPCSNFTLARPCLKYVKCGDCRFCDLSAPDSPWCDCHGRGVGARTAPCLKWQRAWRKE